MLILVRFVSIGNKKKTIIFSCLPSVSIFIIWSQILGKIYDKQNDTLGERVTILEFQVAGLEDDVTDLGEDVDVIDDEVVVILADQVIQDKRILQLEMDSDGICKFSNILF